jgi:dTDP-4-amino-4,6-dideoxygalactose transaminase
MIDFNRPYLTGDEESYIFEAVRNGKISGNGKYTQLCQSFFEQRFKFSKTLLTTSCTDALEMSAILSNIQEGDEVIVPSYTFVSSALAFVRERAKINFADSLPDHPNMDTSKLEGLISANTKAIVVVHYAGISCEMDEIMRIADKYNLIVIEDAAQSIDSYYKGKSLGSIGDFGTFSFHETKNIQCGEGGLLAVNNPKYRRRSEVIWEKGTNRAELFRGEVDKYGWVDTGSSFLPSEITSAYLLAQLESIDKIQMLRKSLWNQYQSELLQLETERKIKLPFIPDYATNNAHMFYIILESKETRTRLIKYLKKNGIHSVFHYLALHKSPYYNKKYAGRELPNAVKFEQQLLRLPLFAELTSEEVSHITTQIKRFFSND